jgi:hypothetical protein
MPKKKDKKTQLRALLRVLQSETRRLETSHPRLVEITNDICEILSEIGI